MTNMISRDDDLIRRGDVLDCFIGIDPIGDVMDFIRALPAVQPVTAHTYKPSMNPNDQGECVICGGSPQSVLKLEPWNPVTSPGMTDLTVDPDSLDAFMEANPLPGDQAVAGAALRPMPELPDWAQQLMNRHKAAVDVIKRAFAAQPEPVVEAAPTVDELAQIIRMDIAQAQIDALRKASFWTKGMEELAACVEEEARIIATAIRKGEQP